MGKSESVEANTVQRPMELNDILNEIEARVEKATGDCWTGEAEHVVARDEQGLCTENQSNSICKLYGPDADANRDFIASSRTDVPKLVKALRELWQAYSDPSSCIGAVVVEHAEKRLASILKG